MSATIDLAPGAGRSQVDELTSRLAAVRAKTLRRSQRLLLLKTSFLVLAAGAFVGAIDFFWPLAFSLRLVAALLIVGAAGVLLIHSRRKAPYTSGDAAADVESAFPSFGQRLRTSLDYASDPEKASPAHAALIGSLQAETEAQARGADFESVVSSTATRSWAAAIGVLLLAIAVTLLVSSEARIAAARVILLPVHYTHVSLAPIDKPIPRGSSATITAVVSGRAIETAQMRYRPIGGKKWKTALLLPAGADASDPPTELSGEIKNSIVNLERDLEVVVVAGPRDLEPLHIRVLQPLELKKATAKITPPQYTQRPVQTTRDASLSVLEGSDVTLRLELSRAPKEVVLAAEAGSAERNEFRSTTGAVATHSFRNLRKTVQFRIVAKTADGVEYTSERRTIRVQADQKPQIALRAPTEELEAIPTAEIHFQPAAQDDLGLHKVGVGYQVNDGPMKTLWETSFNEPTPSIETETVLALEELDLGIQDAITYHAFAEDNYFGMPRRVTTPLRFIDIRPFMREYQVIQAEGGACKACSATLEELIARQRQLVKGSHLASQAEKIDSAAVANLATEQKELFDTTFEFTKGMEERAGKIPPLEEACIAMEESVAELHRPDMEAGFGSQQKALASLIKARQNLRQILKQSNSQQASQCRKFDRQQMQKLRPPEPKKSEKPKQQLSQLRDQIEKLAEKQKQWSQACSQCQNPSTGSSSASSSATSSDPSKPNPSQEQLASEQQANLQQAQEIQKQLERQSASSLLSRERMQAASKAMQDGLESMESGKPQQAGEKAADASQRLNDLSRQLEALGAAELGEKLAAAQQAAARLAEQQSQLADEAEGKPSAESIGADGEQQAAAQSRLARGAEELDELLSRLGAEASAESPETAQKIAAASSANSPQEAAEQMHQAAGDFAANRKQEAAQAGRGAAETLSGLSQDLRAARDAYAQPKLEELIAAEEQAARLLERLSRSPSEANGAAGQEQVDQLADQLRKLSAQDERLAKAVREMTEGASKGENNGGVHESGGDFLKNSGFGEIGQVRVTGVRQVTETLQTKIQEAILAGALQDADDAVPPAYREMVDEYYRTLSEDLR